MNTGICVYVLLAALSTSSCLALPTHSQEDGQPDHVARHTHHTRAASPSGQLSLLSKPENSEDPHSILTELLARIISAKGAYRRSPSVNSRSTGTSHRIKDRDYLGWMDFGRRSAEEYEYSS